MSKTYSIINNSQIADIFYPPTEDRKTLGEGMYKSMVRLPQGASSDNYTQIIEKIFNASDPLENGKMPEIKLGYYPTGNQIETNLEPQELLGALASSGLITQEEMIGAYKDLELTPKNRAIGNGLHPMDTANQKPLNQPSFSL